MDRVAVALQAPEEAEGEDADGEADERHHDPDAGDDGQEQLVTHVVTLAGRKEDQTTCLVTERRRRSLPRNV